VREAEDKAPLCDGTIYVAAPNYHLLIERDRSLSLSIGEPVHHSRPAIDVLFASAADAYGPAVAGLVLSGANQDGAEGLFQIRQAGGVAIVQAPATASSPMMPDAALRRVGPATHVVPLGDLGAFLARLLGARTGGRDFSC
jgi:two-component system chemotaxis response regulator CheB